MNRALLSVTLGVFAISITAMLYWGNDDATVPESTRPAVPEEPLTLPLSRQVTVPPSPSSRIHPLMLVTDSSGKPIPGAEICIPAAENRQVFFTDVRGEAKLIGCTAGVGHFWITRKGYIGVDSKITVTPQEVTRVTLLKFAKVVGTVTNGRGEPVSGASVQLKYEAASEPRGSFMVTPDDNKLVQRGAISAADGRFEILTIALNRVSRAISMRP